MPNDIFYVYPEIGAGKEGYINPDKRQHIAAKFLKIDGKYVVDPNPQQVHLYTKLDSANRIDESSIISNPGNYMVVPADYDPAEARKFAANVDADMKGTAQHFGKDLAMSVGLAEMTWAFLPGHAQDLQKRTRWGVPKSETSPAFRDGASWNFGYVAQQVDLPQKDAIEGAGALNRTEHSFETIWTWRNGKNQPKNLMVT